MRNPTKHVLAACLTGALCGAAYGAEFSLIPVGASGAYTINGNQIVLEGGGQYVTLEIWLDNWDPVPDVGVCSDGFTVCSISDPDCPGGGACVGNNGLLIGWQAKIDSTGYAGVLGPAIPTCSENIECGIFGDPFPECNTTEGECEPSVSAFIDMNHPDYVFSGIALQFAFVDTGTLDYRFSASLMYTSDAAAYAGAGKYCGTLVLDVPASTAGMFTVGFVGGNQTVLRDTNQIPIVPVDIVSAIIAIACQEDQDCDDDNACTTDVCELDGTCSYELNHDPAYCCDPDTGDLTLIDDGNDCTDDICNPDGSVDHPFLPEGAACGDPFNSQCDNPDTCNSTGLCLDNLEPFGEPCGDSTEDECDHADTCDGEGTCETNIEPPGAPCGDDDDTDCTDPDTCDGVGTCLANNVTDGVECDDDLFCNVGETCTGGVCSGGGERDCEDGLSCTTDFCDEDADTCVSELDPGNCLINDECYAEGEYNPENDCEECDTGISTGDWSFREAGAECDDGNPCTDDDVCDGEGVCEGVPNPNCNDTCADAIEVFEGMNVSTNATAGDVDDAEASCTEDSNHDVWFRYTALCNGELFMSTTGSQFAPTDDSVLSVYDNCDDLNELACDDDSGVGLHAALVLNTTISTEYFIRVAGFEDNVGDIVLNILPVNDCVIDGTCYAEGTTNPLNDCEECNPVLSSLNWSPRAEGSACGDQNEDECNNPDACDGAGVCESNFKPDGTECPDDGNDCTDDVCNTGSCSHPPYAPGTPCGDDADTECDNPDTCDGTGFCLDNFEVLGVPCGDPSSDQCDDPDTCDGNGSCVDNYKPDGTPCNDEDICTGDDICDGTGGCLGTAIAEAPVVEPLGSRRIQATPLPAGAPGMVALRLTSPDDWPCLFKYIDVDGSLTDTPVFQLIDDWETVIVSDVNIVPSSTYNVEAECGVYVSDAGSAQTYLWCDHDNTGEVNIDDILLVIAGFQSDFSQTTMEIVDVSPCAPNKFIDIDDVIVTIWAFQSLPYSHTGCPVPCP